MPRRPTFDNITTAKNSTASAISPPSPKPTLRQRLPFTYSAFFISSTKAVAANQKPIRAAKYTRSRKSITPLEIASKCVKKLRDAMASTMTCGKHAAHEIQHQRKSGQQKHESHQGRGDEGDHLIARGGRQTHADREETARHQKAADIRCDDRAVIGRT